MKFLYGYANTYVDITDIVLKKCFQDNGIVIPSGEEERCQLIGYDPFPGILKYIVVIDDNDNQHRFMHNREVIIKIDSISKQLFNLNDTKLWWNTEGKYIEDHGKRLFELHNRLTLIHGNMQDELVEQMMVITYLDQNAKVLELGGNIGRNTLLISTILNDPSNLVTFESDPNIANALKQNIKVNKYNNYVEACALSKNRLIQKGWDTVLLDENVVIPDDWKEVATMTYGQLTKKYDIDFDTLVADCEGALYYILRDEPDLIKNMKLLIVENDYKDISHKHFIDDLFKKNGFQRIFHKSGGWGPCTEFFWEVWKKDN